MGEVVDGMVGPRLLELSVVDELTAIDNMEVLKKNGFVVQVDEVVPEGERPKLRLAAQPMSKGTMFDMKGRSLLPDAPWCLLMCVRCRFGRDITPNERRQPKRNDPMLKGPRNVRDARVSQLNHDWHRAQAPAHGQRESPATR